MQRVKALDKTLPMQSNEDQAVVANFNIANTFNLKQIQASKHADQILEELKGSAGRLLYKSDLDTELSGATDAVRQAYGELYKFFSDGIETLIKELQSKRETLTKAETDWIGEFRQARNNRNAVLEKLSEHKTVTTQIIKLREEISDIEIEIGNIEVQVNTVDPTEALRQSLDDLKSKNDLRKQRTKDWANEIEKLSSEKIKAGIYPNGDISEIIDAIEFVARKTRSQTATRTKGLEEVFAANPTANDVNDVIDGMRTESLSLLHWRQIGSASGEEPPRCSNLSKVLGDTDRIHKELRERIDTARVEAIYTALAKPESRYIIATVTGKFLLKRHPKVKGQLRCFFYCWNKKEAH